MPKNIESNTSPDVFSSDEENLDNQLSPLKRNILRIFSAVLFALLIWGTVSATDYIINIIGNLF